MTTSFLSHTAIFEAMVCSIIIVDTELRVQYMNPAAEVLMGHSLSQHREKPLEQLIHTSQLHAHILNAIHDAQSHVTRESKIHLSNQDEMTVDCAVTPLYDNEDIIGSLLEINQVDRKLRIMRDEQLLVQQQNSQIVLKGIAHEVKNPLSGIRAAAQLLELEFEDQSLKEYTQIIMSEIDRLKGLMERMLGSSQLPNMQTVNIHEVMEHVYHLLKNCKPNNISINTDYDPSLPEFTGDRNQLVQVVLNIANNAIHALCQHDTQNKKNITFKTRVQRYFTIDHKLHPLVLCASIIDNGAGIPDNLKDKIFSPMVSGNSEGTGLGLSIAQSLVNRQGGLIEYSRKKEKTEFNIYIPLKKT